MTTGGAPSAMVLTPSYLFEQTVKTLTTGQTTTFTANITLFYGMFDQTWNITLSKGKTHTFYVSNSTATSAISMNGDTNTGIKQASKLASSSVTVDTSVCWTSFNAWTNEVFSQKGQLAHALRFLMLAAAF